MLCHANTISFYVLKIYKHVPFPVVLVLFSFLVITSFPAVVVFISSLTSIRPITTPHQVIIVPIRYQSNTITVTTSCIMQLYMPIYCTVCRVQIMTFGLLLSCEGKVQFTLTHHEGWGTEV